MVCLTLYTGRMEDDWYEKRKKAKKWMITGLAMAVAAIVIDWFAYYGVDRAGNKAEGMTYGYITGFFLFPIMIAGLVIFVINLYRFIKYK